MADNRNKRIAKNTMMLYIRMLLLMAVTLYTSRVVLNTLGVSDFGIYNVVGGAVAMFGFLSSSMSTATQRFLSYELGQKEKGDVGRVFCMSINTHWIIAIVIFVLIEIVGVWFLTHKLNIPIERMDAAWWVFQCAAVVFVVNFISIPFTALIIAYEKSCDKPALILQKPNCPFCAFFTLVLCCSQTNGIQRHKRRFRHRKKC